MPPEQTRGRDPYVVKWLGSCVWEEWDQRVDILGRGSREVELKGKDGPSLGKVQMHRCNVCHMFLRLTPWVENFCSL